MAEDEFLAACAAQDWPRALTLVDQGWTRLVFAEDTYRAVFALLAEAPEDEVRRHPRATLMAESIGRLAPGAARVLLPDDAQVDATVRAGRAREHVELAILGMVARRAAGLPQEALELAQASLPLLRATTRTRFSPAADLASYWHLQAAQAALHAGELDQARRHVEQCWAFRADDVTGYAATSGAPFGVLLAALAGDAAGQARWQREVDALAERGRTLIEWETMERPALVAALLSAVDRLDVTTAAPLAEALVPQLAFDELWPITLVAIVRHLVDTDATERAADLVATTTGRHPTPAVDGSIHTSFTALARAEIARARGRSGPLSRLLAETPMPALGALQPVHLALLGDDRPSARRLAAEAEHGASDQRVRRESRLVGLALADEPPPADRPVLPDALRRTAALLAPALNDRLRSSYDGVPEARAVPVSAEPVVRLTPAEARVLAALDGPASLPEVAERLYVSRNTLKTHLRSLYAKLGASSRPEALARAGRLGLLGNDEGPPP